MWRSEFPKNLSKEVDVKIRAEFDILLTVNVMEAGDIHKNFKLLLEYTLYGT